MYVVGTWLSREGPSSKADFQGTQQHSPNNLSDAPVFSFWLFLSSTVSPQLLEQYAEQVSWQSEIRHEAIRFPPMEKMIVDYQVIKGF